MTRIMLRAGWLAAVFTTLGIAAIAAAPQVVSAKAAFTGGDDPPCDINGQHATQCLKAMPTSNCLQTWNECDMAGTGNTKRCNTGGGGNGCGQPSVCKPHNDDLTNAPCGAP